MSEKSPPGNLSPLCIMLFITTKEPALLQQTIDSIKQQTCSEWELFIVVADQETINTDKFHSILNNKQKINTETLFSTLPPHKIITHTKSKYIVFLALGDRLHQDFVLHFFQQQQKLPSLRLFYSDHGLLSKGSKKPLIHFKPDWNPDYLCSFNYISYVAVFSCDDLLKITDLLDRVEKDYFHQLLLTVTQQYNKEVIYHLAKPLVQLQLIEKDDSKATTLLTKYFNTSHTLYRYTLSLPDPAPLVSIIIPTKNQFKLLKQCIDSLLEKTSYPHFELLVIDNQSNDPVALEYLEQLASLKNIRVLHYPHTFNYSAINNFATKQAKGSLIALLNNDTEIIHPDWLTEMVIHACRLEIGCVGAKLIYPDGSIQHGGVILGIYGTASHAHKHFPNEHTGYFNRLITVHNVSAVTAACLVMRKDVFNQVGGFDEVNLKVAYNDVDLCLKVLEQGYRNLWTPYAELIHHESKSRGKKRSWWQRRKLNKEGLFLKKKWGDLLLNDPAYNPNLTLNREDFSLRK
jgi:GT2 family glycosyltransferase